MAAAPTDLAQKLGLQPGMRVALLHPPKQANDAIRAGAPPGVRWKLTLGKTHVDLIFFWPSETAGLAREFARLQASLEPDGAVWAVMPKKAFAAGRGVSFSWDENAGRGIARRPGRQQSRLDHGDRLRDPLRHSKGEAAALASLRKSGHIHT